MGATCRRGSACLEWSGAGSSGSEFRRRATLITFIASLFNKAIQTATTRFAASWSEGSEAKLSEPASYPLERRPLMKIRSQITSISCPRWPERHLWAGQARLETSAEDGADRDCGLSEQN